MAQPTAFERAFDLLLAQLKLGTAGVPSYRRAAAAARQGIGPGGLVFEAGLEQAGMAEGAGLRARLLARRVERIHFAPGVTTSDLLHLAEALAADDLPLAEDGRVRCEMVVDIVPQTQLRLTPLPDDLPAADPSPSPDPAGEARSREPRHTVDVSEDIERLRHAVADAGERGAWTEALHAAQALTSLIRRVPERDRGSLTILIKRLLTAGLVRDFLDFAVRMPEEQPRLAQVLHHGGREALEVVVDAVTETTAVGPKRFLLGVLQEAPDAFPLLEGLLRSHRPHAVQLGAALLAGTGNAEAIPALKAQAGHEHPGVRAAVFEALAAFPKANVADALREGLADRIPAVRIAAAAALAAWGSGGVVMPILGALEREKEAEVRLGFIRALGTIDGAESATALAAIALEKRSMLTRRGYPEQQRLAAVEGLAKGTTRAARAALERVAEEADGAVRAAARTAAGLA